jgi:hypothetical protein
MGTEEIRVAFLDINGENERQIEGTAAEIADEFDVPLAKVEQVCEWADEMGCTQGFATGPASSVIVEPI